MTGAPRPVPEDPTGGMSALETVDAFDPYVALARETGRILGELGVRPEDDHWIRIHSATIESLRYADRPRRRSFLDGIYRFARRAARTAR